VENYEKYIEAFIKDMTKHICQGTSSMPETPLDQLEELEKTFSNLCLKEVEMENLKRIFSVKDHELHIFKEKIAKKYFNIIAYQEHKSQLQ